MVGPSSAEIDTMALTREIKSLEQELADKQQALKRQQQLRQSQLAKERNGRQQAAVRASPQVLVSPARQGSVQRATDPSTKPPKPQPSPGGPESIPLSQLRGMLRERMRGAMMTDKTALRRLFEKYDTDAGGTIDADEFQAVLEEIGVRLTLEQATSFMKRLSGGATKLTFAALFGNLQGVPRKFFETTMTVQKQDNSQEEHQPKVVSNKPQLPHSTSIRDLQRLLVRRLKDKWLNTQNSLSQVLGKPLGSHFATESDIFNIFWTEMGLGLSPSDLRVMMDNFGVMGDDRRFEFKLSSCGACAGKVHYVTFLRELLGLSIPRRDRQLYLPRQRGGLNQKCSNAIAKLKKRCERGSARQAQLFKMFQAYDGDGSGSMTRDEFQAICDDLDIAVQGRDAPSELLQSYDRSGTGSLSYDQFVSTVLGLEAGLLSAPEPPRTAPRHVKPSRPATPVIVDACQQKIKEMILGSRAASEKAFKVFDRRGRGTLKRAEILDALGDLGISVTPKQADQLFQELDVEKNGEVPLDVLSERVLDYDRLEDELQAAMSKLDASQNTEQHDAPPDDLEQKMALKQTRSALAKVGTPYATTSVAEAKHHSEPDQNDQNGRTAGTVETMVNPNDQLTGGGRPQSSIGARFLRNREGVHRLLKDEWLQSRNRGKTKGNLVQAASGSWSPAGSRPGSAPGTNMRASGNWWENGTLTAGAATQGKRFRTKPPASANANRVAMSQQKVKMASASWDLPSGLKNVEHKPFDPSSITRPATALDRVRIQGQSQSRPSSVPMLQRPKTPYRPYATLKTETHYGSDMQSELALSTSFQGGVL